MLCLRYSYRNLISWGAVIFSNLYLAISVRYYHNLYNSSEIFTEYVVDKLISENQEKINIVVKNMGIEGLLVLHLLKNKNPINYNQERNIFKEIINNENILTEIKKNIYLKGILNDFDKISKLDESSKEYNNLKNKIINVGEFKNKNITEKKALGYNLYKLTPEKKYIFKQKQNSENRFKFMSESHV